MKELFDRINTFRNKQSYIVDYEIINEKQKELNVILPDAMRELFEQSI